MRRFRWEDGTTVAMIRGTVDGKPVVQAARMNFNFEDIIREAMAIIEEEERGPGEVVEMKPGEDSEGV